MRTLYRLLPVLGPVCLLGVGLFLSVVGWSMPQFLDNAEVQELAANQLWFGPDLSVGAHNRGMMGNGILLVIIGIAYGCAEYYLAKRARQSDGLD